MLPCIEDYTKIDLRTVTFDIPPQEVREARVLERVSACSLLTVFTRVFV